MKKILVILMLAFMLVSCIERFVYFDKLEEKENKKTEDILKTKVEEDINPNLESEVTVE